MQYRRISADCHLDMIWLPPDLFTSEAARALKDEMPYVKEQPDGTKRWIDNNGADFGKAGGVGAVGSEYVPGKQLRVDKMHEAGLYDDFVKKGHRRPGDPHLRENAGSRGGERDAAHLQQFHEPLLQLPSRSRDRSRLPAL